MAEKKEKKGLNMNVLLLVIGVPLLVVIGVVAGFYLTGGNAQMVSGTVAEEEVEVAETTVALEEFLLNLEPTDNQSNYIRLSISLATTQEDGVEEINANLDKIRDVIIQTVSQLTRDEVFNEEAGTRNLKDTLKSAINAEFGEELINSIYITNIVVQ